MFSDIVCNAMTHADCIGPLGNSCQLACCRTLLPSTLPPTTAAPMANLSTAAAAAPVTDPRRRAPLSSLGSAARSTFRSSAVPLPSCPACCSYPCDAIAPLMELLRELLGLNAALAHRGARVGTGFVGMAEMDLVVNSSSRRRLFERGQLHPVLGGRSVADRGCSNRPPS